MLNYLQAQPIQYIQCLFIGVILLIIVWQDFRKYEVSLWLYPAGFIILSIFSIFHLGFSNYILRLLINCFFVFLLLGTVWFYFWTKNRKKLKFTDNYIGWGDILFFILVAPALSIMQYVLFLIVSFVIGLMYSLIYYIIKKSLQKIPLAGIMAFLFLALIIYNLVTMGKIFFNGHQKFEIFGLL